MENLQGEMKEIEILHISALFGFSCFAVLKS